MSCSMYAMREKIWSEDAWKDYLYWQTQDKKTLKRINEKDRLVYHMEDGRIYIAHCKGHYGDK